VLQLTRPGGPPFALNPDLIEKAEATPETVVTLISGTRYVICESLEELSELINTYRAQIIATAQLMTDRGRQSQPREQSGRASLVVVRPREH
jgi:flagellar protein FlbD